MPSHLQRLVNGSALIQSVALPQVILDERGGEVSRAAIAAALVLRLLEELLQRVPSGRAYVEETQKDGRKLVFDHGAVRTVAESGMGTLPRGEEAITRVLRPLGYVLTHTYPMPALKMTGRSYTHRDFPEGLPQFFLSELYPDRFSPAFRKAVRNVTSSSIDPLAPGDKDLLKRLGSEQTLPIEDASRLLPRLAGAFARHHETPALGDYRALRAESAEMAWIATEGNAFNHATDRVASLEEVAARQRALGRRVKDRIEISASGRVRQTAFHADPVVREFLDQDGGIIRHEVPGSFFEFIQRDRIPGEHRLDLAFDTNNAQGIFKMTAAQ